MTAVVIQSIFDEQERLEKIKVIECKDEYNGKHVFVGKSFYTFLAYTGPEYLWINPNESVIKDVMHLPKQQYHDRYIKVFKEAGDSIVDITFNKQLGGL